MDLRYLKKTIASLITLVALGVVSAYAADEAINTAESYDGYAKATGITTDKFTVPDVGSFVSPAFAFASLRGSVADAGVESMELLIYYHDAKGWKFFSSALDSDGNTLPVRELDRQAEGTIGISEQFAASLSRPYLESHKQSGLDIRFGGKYGFLTVKLPANYVVAFLDRLEKVETGVRGKLANQSIPPTSLPSEKLKFGVNYLPVSEAFAKVAAMETPKGIFLVRVINDSVAAKAGLKVGDAILAIDGIPIPVSTSGLQNAISGVKSGSLVNMTVWRGGREITLPIKF